jgi:16S rRNA (uracil1498-N3)-methyltransferase
MERPIRRAPPRFYVPASLSVGAEISLPERATKHVAVLRLREGDAITLFNGEGGEYSALLAHFARGHASARINARMDVQRESGLDITLAQCLSSNDRMDVTLQKATELGIRVLIPLESERSVVRLSGERMDRRLAHWRNVVFAACEQCGRNSPPAVQPVERLLPWLMALGPPATTHSRLMLDPDASAGLSGLAAATGVVLLVGPEGGLAPHEKAFAMKAAFRPLRLGPRTLRTETAPLAAVAALQTLWGDLG